MRYRITYENGRHYPKAMTKSGQKAHLLSSPDAKKTLCDRAKHRLIAMHTVHMSDLCMQCLHEAKALQESDKGKHGVKIETVR